MARKLFGSLEDLQYDSRTSTAGVSTTRNPQASVLASGDYTVARKLFGSLEDLAAHGNLRTRNQSVLFECSRRTYMRDRKSTRKSFA